MNNLGCPSLHRQPAEEAKAIGTHGFIDRERLVWMLDRSLFLCVTRFLLPGNAVVHRPVDLERMVHLSSGCQYLRRGRGAAAPSVLSEAAPYDVSLWRGCLCFLVQGPAEAGHSVPSLLRSRQVGRTDLRPFCLRAAGPYVFNRRSGRKPVCPLRGTIPPPP